MTLLVILLLLFLPHSAYNQGLHSACIHEYNKLTCAIMFNILNITPDYNAQEFELCYLLFRTCFQAEVPILSL